tara:strand:- start:864 stop:1016 length:153 start_codon:yes stop_codon:yes gene_type:complete
MKQFLIKFLKWGDVHEESITVQHESVEGALREFTNVNKEVKILTIYEVRK